MPANGSQEADGQTLKRQRRKDTDSTDKGHGFNRQWAWIQQIGGADWMNDVVL